MTPADWCGCARATPSRGCSSATTSPSAIAAGEPISVHELLYPFVQAYDSVALRGGRRARRHRPDLQSADGARDPARLRTAAAGGDHASAARRHRRRRQDVEEPRATSIGITEQPEDMYGKVMSISDELMLEYFDLLRAGEWDDLRRTRGSSRAVRGDPLAVQARARARDSSRASTARSRARARGAHFRARRPAQGGARRPAGARARGWTRRASAGCSSCSRRSELVRSRGEARRLVEQNARSASMGSASSDAAARLRTRLLSHAGSGSGASRALAIVVSPPVASRPTGSPLRHAPRTSPAGLTLTSA